MRIHFILVAFNNSVVMILRQQIWNNLWKEFNGYCLFHSRCYSSSSSKINWSKLRPLIHKRIQHRSGNYPLKNMIPVAYDVLNARADLVQGVSTLLKYIPMKACKFCSEVYIGEHGHQIQTCHGFRRRAKNQVHEWIDGCLNDILVPIEAFHLRSMFQDLIKHDQRFDFERIPAVLELCCQAGANIFDDNLHSYNWTSDTNEIGVAAETNMPQELNILAVKTLEAWESLISGVQRLLLVYPTKVCKHCSEVHIGPSGHKARLCGVFKHESWRGSHIWKKADVRDLIPPKVVWRRRPQDPPVLYNEGRDYYGHAPAVVELCFQAGAIVPLKYHCMMKINGLPPTSNSIVLK
ncbi:hypothetical protein AQUCO_00100470v1 [Aquilegia coerulea]|uniref:APO domain-containing protein n=2 Tax=Aquilegia coerulea TaxID=218851 RepID=A0A2G5FAK5_AQUCA|nr:hypothetical protein AQUCO_00100470v1 [Aquilegia coerulea]